MPQTNTRNKPTFAEQRQLNYSDWLAAQVVIIIRSVARDLRGRPAKSKQQLECMKAQRNSDVSVNREEIK